MEQERDVRFLLMRRIRFAADGVPYDVVFDFAPLRVLQSYRQYWPWSREAGGQLFGRREDWRFVVTEATPPRPEDVRSRTEFVIDTVAANTEIAERRRRGMEYLGDWHTHPQEQPEPSPQDRRNGLRMMGGRNAPGALVIVIVGIRATYVGLQTAKSLTDLRASR